MSDPFLGEIKIVAFNFSPRGWTPCDGQLLPISSNQSLFSLYGTTYGGDGRTNFGLPNLRSRAAMHFGTGPGLTPRILGQKLGVASLPLTVAQLPSHTHTHPVTAKARQAALGSQTDPTDKTWAVHPPAEDGYPYSTSSPDTTMSPGTATSDFAGSGGAHNNMQPYLAVNFICALVGLFPSRQ